MAADAARHRIWLERSQEEAASSAAFRATLAKVEQQRRWNALKQTIYNPRINFTRCAAPSSSPRSGCNNCGAARPRHGSHRKPWGLPSSGCSNSWVRYWTEVYPKQHAEWRARGRVVVHCTDHNGLGNYLKSLPSALIYSAATEQALTLACDGITPGNSNASLGHVESLINEARYLRDEGRQGQLLPTLLSKYFRSEHIDLFFPFKLPRKAPTVDLYARVGQPAYWAYENCPHCVLAATNGSRVMTGQQVPPRRVLLYARHHHGTAFKANWSVYFPGKASEEILRQGTNLDGCLLRMMLSPKPELLDAIREATGGIEPDPANLMPIAAMHVRLGDAGFAHDGWQYHSWYAANETRRSALDVHPRAVFDCLERMSGDGVADATSSSCVSCAVVSDSSEVAQCAKAALKHPIITSGSPIHLAASSSTSITDGNLLKILIDWFILSQSRATILLHSQSTFAYTAFAYKAASDASVHWPMRIAPEPMVWPHVLLNGLTGTPFEDVWPWEREKNLAHATQEQENRPARAHVDPEAWWRSGKVCNPPGKPR